VEAERHSTPTNYEIKTGDATKLLHQKIGHALQDEWPCKGPDVKGRARPGPNILNENFSRKGAKSNPVLSVSLCAFAPLLEKFSIASMCFLAVVSVI
jgi:hypothetical protein